MSKSRASGNKPTGKQSYHHGDLREVLLDEAAALIREEGEAKLSMRHLAARVGVSHTAPYHHFKDKQELLCGIAEEGFRQFVDVLTLKESRLTEDSLRRFVKGYLEFALDKAEYYDLMFGGHLWKSAGITDALKQQSHSAFRFYLEQVRGWRDQRLVDQSIDPLRYSQVSWSTLHGMSRLLIDGIYVDSSAIDAMCDAAASMFWRELKQS